MKWIGNTSNILNYRSRGAWNRGRLFMARENVEEPEEYRRSVSLTLMQCGSTKGGVRLARGWLARYPRSDMRLR